MASIATFERCTANAPPGANLYAVCASSLRFTLQPPPYPWLSGVVLALSIVYGLLAMGFALVLTLRWTRGDRIFFSRDPTPHGSVIVPHLLNLACASSLAYLCAAQVNSASAASLTF